MNGGRVPRRWHLPKTDERDVSQSASAIRLFRTQDGATLVARLTVGVRKGTGKNVSLSSSSMEKMLLKPLVYLLPQPIHIDIHHVRGRRKVAVPDALGNRVAVQHLSRM